MAEPLLLAIDQGTTSTRAIAFGPDLRLVASARVPIHTTYPRPGWVEQDPEEVLDSVVAAVGAVVMQVGGAHRIVAVGLANQGESVVAWDHGTQRALTPIVVWQCRRSQAIVDRLRADGAEERIRQRTGLPLDPYYSSTKLTWLLEHDRQVRTAAERGDLRFGTVDAWLTLRLDGGDARTDHTTASRTQLYDLGTRDWSDDLLAVFGVGREILPRLVPTNGDLGRLSHPSWGGPPLRLHAMACDQQAALAGHGAFKPGALKVTYGTGAFVLANAGERTTTVVGLETSVGWVLHDGSSATVLQGGVFTAAAVLDWLRDGVGLVDDLDTAASAPASVDYDRVRILPALAGVGAPWWAPDARMVIAGLSGATRQADILRAARDGIAQRVTDIVEAMVDALPERPTTLRADGGLSRDARLMQRQADVLGLPVHVARNDESTALGIAGLAGMAAGTLDRAALTRANPSVRVYDPGLTDDVRSETRAGWEAFVRTALTL